MVMKVDVETVAGLQYLIEVYRTHTDIYLIWGFGGRRRIQQVSDLIRAYLWLQDFIKPDTIKDWTITII